MRRGSGPGPVSRWGFSRGLAGPGPGRLLPGRRTSRQPPSSNAFCPTRAAKSIREFDQILEADGIEVKRVGPRAPNLNAYAERWVRSVKQECLDHFVVLGEGHLRRLPSPSAAHYNQE